VPDLTVSDASGQGRFAPFSLDIGDYEAIEALRDDSETTYTFSVTGSGSRAAQAKLRAVETRHVVRYSRNMAGTFDAAAGRGELVALALSVYRRGAPDSSEAISKTGIITSVAWSAGTGGFLVQRCDFLFQVCDVLHVANGSEYTRLGAPGETD
jgi:hypothetical protein